ncbi:hypothetical protein CAL7716_101500 (plasmid) [Calothrix sp. PCC 7716]|nr:hypothetical protein CAL7716_101500 [Calothrix sp. PCC 7716]
MIEKTDTLSPEEYRDLYLKVWEKEQSYIQIRWTVVTFFISVSFAIMGFSFNISNPKLPIIIPQLIGCGIYWFAFLVHLVLYDLTEYYREYLLSMEREGLVKYDVRTRANKFFSERRNKLGRPHPTALLAYFGIGYTLVVVLIAIKLYLF